MVSRGIRGAITVDEDNASSILEATTLLLQTIHAQNDFAVDDITSILFTATRDIKSVYPAQAARDLGWDKVPLLCFQEMEVEGALPLCIRVLVIINTEKKAVIKPVYLRKAIILRPDI